MQAWFTGVAMKAFHIAQLLDGGRWDMRGQMP